MYSVTARTLIERLMLRDNLLSLSVDVFFLRQDIVDLVSHLCVT